MTDSSAEEVLLELLELEEELVEEEEEEEVPVPELLLPAAAAGVAEGCKLGVGDAARVPLVASTVVPGLELGAVVGGFA
jgi:hypothetical protein